MPVGKTVPKGPKKPTVRCSGLYYYVNVNLTNRNYDYSRHALRRSLNVSTQVSVVNGYCKSPEGVLKYCVAPNEVGDESKIQQEQEERERWERLKEGQKKER